MEIYKISNKNFKENYINEYIVYNKGKLKKIKFDNNIKTLGALSTKPKDVIYISVLDDIKEIRKKMLIDYILKKNSNIGEITGESYTINGDNLILYILFIYKNNNNIVNSLNITFNKNNQNIITTIYPSGILYNLEDYFLNFMFELTMEILKTGDKIKDTDSVISEEDIEGEITRIENDIKKFRDSNEYKNDNIDEIIKNFIAKDNIMKDINELFIKYIRTNISLENKDTNIIVVERQNNSHIILTITNMYKTYKDDIYHSMFPKMGDNRSIISEEFVNSMRDEVYKDKSYGGNRLFLCDSLEHGCRFADIFFDRYIYITEGLIIPSIKVEILFGQKNRNRNYENEQYKKLKEVAEFLGIIDINTDMDVNIFGEISPEKIFKEYLKGKYSYINFIYNIDNNKNNFLEIDYFNKENILKFLNIYYNKEKKYFCTNTKEKINLTNDQLENIKNNSIIIENTSIECRNIDSDLEPFFNSLL